MSWRLTRANLQALMEPKCCMPNLGCKPSVCVLQPASRVPTGRRGSCFTFRGSEARRDDGPTVPERSLRECEARREHSASKDRGRSLNGGRFVRVRGGGRRSTEGDGCGRSRLVAARGILRNLSAKFCRQQQ